jgi:hypothetical protein
MITIVCPQCGKAVDKPTGAVNRALNIGAPIYCGRECAGLGRRLEKSVEQKKEEKRLYDIDYRLTNRLKLKGQKTYIADERQGELSV